MENKTNNINQNFSKNGCDYCILPHDYKPISFRTDETGKSKCINHRKQNFKGLEQLEKDINLNDNEKVGVMVSGGKDGLYAWMTLCKIFGSDRVIAFNHHKKGMVHELAYQNIINASNILKSKVVIVEDEDFLPRFKKNFEALIKKIDASMVRVALCAGCRYGITGKLYEIANEKYNITKFVSAASYLEEAPFKPELLKEKGNGNPKYGLIKGLSENSGYNFPQNIEIILKDDNLSYKDSNENGRIIAQEYKKYQLFDLDNYIPNNPKEYELSVTKNLNWKRPERSWRFDCLVEIFKDFFYYGLLGYTELEFKLSQMIRYNLINRDEALNQIEQHYLMMDESINDVLILLDKLDLAHLKNDIISFYNNSSYFRKHYK